MSEIGPWSKPDRLAKVDGRSKIAKKLKSLRTELVQHLGGNCSATQSLLIDQACQLQIRLMMMDAEDATGGAMTDRTSRQYLAWANSLQRLLRQLGLKGSAQRAPSLAAHMAAKVAPKP